MSKRSVLMLAVVLAGCAAPAGPTFKDYAAATPVSANNRVRIVAYRTGNTLNSGDTATVRVDGRPMGDCRYSRFISFEVWPGPHQIGVSGPDAVYCEIPINVESGKDYFYKVHPKYTSLLIHLYTCKFWMEQVTPEQAHIEVDRLHLSQ